jgi:hypothetical protein
MRSRDEEILNIVSNLNKPINERIIDKIQKSTKKAVASTYNFSTTDKSKGDEVQNINIFNKKINENQKAETPRVNQLKKQENDIKIKKVDKFQMINCPISPADQEKPIIFTNRKSIDVIQINRVPSSSKNNKNFFNNNQITEVLNKSPTTSKNKLGAGQSLKKQANKVIEYKQIKLINPSTSTKFANLLYSSEANFKNINSNRNTSNPHAKLENRSTKANDNKIDLDNDTPPYPTNNSNRYFETSSKQQEEKQLTLNLNKILRTRQLSTHNADYENLLAGVLKIDRAGSTKHNMEKLNKENDSDTNRLKKLRSDQNFLTNNSKLNNYLNNSKKINPGGNIVLSEDHPQVSSFSNTKTNSYTNQIKIKYSMNERQFSTKKVNNLLDSKGKAYNYLQAEQKPLSNSKGFSKPKELTHAVSDNKLLKKNTPLNRRMKSGDFFSNNYLNTNNSNNVNAILQKINSTRSINNATDKIRKAGFSPGGLMRKI